MALMVAACGSPPEVRYKIRLEVEDHGELRSASSVWSFRLSKSFLPLASTYNAEFHGDALLIRLSDGGALLAILRGAEGDGSSPAMMPERIFGDIGRAIRREPMLFGGDRTRDMRDLLTRTGEKRAFNGVRRRGDRPMLIILRDPSDSTSVEEVQPSSPGEALTDDVILRSFTVELTDQAVTRTIAAQLPWLAHQRGALLRRPRGIMIGDMPLAGRLTEGDFSQ